MESVLKRPWTDEVEDYTEYKRIRDVERDVQKTKEEKKPIPKVAVDGVLEVFEDETAQTSFQDEFTDRIFESPKGLSAPALAELPSNTQL